ncbi:hypothetical protein [Nocardiopsis salina]|uniref:hypothetical protein n=1 Tax=Nocardiopsis salina TaxID=245836 RepID=UPI000345E708|nr:hypothetical protein [Nocardiopsis salina]
MSGPRAIGTRAETGVVRYLREHGWPDAERRALAGGNDLGDVTGTPGLCWEIKSGRVAERATDGDIVRWLDETETERENSGADLGILITKRAGYSAERVGDWWAHLDLMTLFAVVSARAPLAPTILGEPVRMHVSTLVELLHTAGYGTPLDAEAVA